MIKKKFTQELDGITYQGELPLDVLSQLKMSQLFFFEQRSGDSLADKLEIATQLDMLIFVNSIIVEKDKELLVKGMQNNGLEPKHLRTLSLLYRNELILPLL